ncbi:hypothetical protein D3C81_1283250 [compost metagenome]
MFAHPDITHEVETIGGKRIHQAFLHGITQAAFTAQGFVEQRGGGVLQQLVFGKMRDTLQAAQTTGIGDDNFSGVGQCAFGGFRQRGGCTGRTRGPVIEETGGQTRGASGHNVIFQVVSTEGFFERRSEIAFVVNGADGRRAGCRSDHGGECRVRPTCCHCFAGGCRG